LHTVEEEESPDKPSDLQIEEAESVNESDSEENELHKMHMLQSL